MTRQGCVGKIKTCFSPEKEGSFGDWPFWNAFDRSGSGACVALQNSPAGLYTNDAEFGPLFMPCSTLNYLACEGIGEGEGKNNKYVTESVLNMVWFGFWIY